MVHQFLLIHLTHLHIRSNRPISTQYFSFTANNHYYFSKAYDGSMIENYSILINNSIIIPFAQSQVPTHLQLQNWHQHMILFQHDVSIIQLHNRFLIKKKVEVRSGQILQFSIQLLNQQEFQLSPIFQQNMLQHFLFIHQLKLNDQNQGGLQDVGPSYIIIIHDDHKTIVPVINAILTIPLPSTVKFQHVKNGKIISFSQEYDFRQIDREKMVIDLLGKTVSGSSVQIGCLWGINLQRKITERAMLVDSQELMLYDIQLKLQGWKESPVGLKLKLLCGNKCFELNIQPDASKVIRLARIVYFIAKSEEQSFVFILQKGLKIVARVVFHLEQLLSYHINILKKKMLELGTGREMASLKLKCEKAKNLSLPQNNAFWKQQISKGLTKSVKLQCSQISMEHQGNGNYELVIKTQQQEFVVQNIPNFNTFKLQIAYPAPVVLTLKHSYSIFLKIIDESSESIGIATINFRQLRLGTNCLSLPLFKDKITVCHINMIINKIVPWPFVKGIAHPQNMHTSSKLMKVSVNIKKITFNQYFYSYKYDRKSDVYCIIQVNKVKKVLILEKFNTASKAILFASANGSDVLNYSVDYHDSVMIKCTFLVCDMQVQEQIYGSFYKKINLGEIGEGPNNLAGIIANQHSIEVGQLDLQVQKTGVNVQHKKPIKQELKEVKKNIEKINRSIQQVEFYRKSPKQNRKGKYQSIVLPQIKDPKQERFNRIKNLRKQRSLEKKPVLSQRNLQYEQQGIQQQRYYTPIDLQPIEKVKDKYFGVPQKQDLSRLDEAQGIKEESKVSKMQINFQSEKNQFIE